MKRRKTLRIFFSIGILCLVVLWGYAVLSVNRQYRDKRQFIQIEPGQAADINGLEVRAADSGIYDIAAFWKAYEQYNLTRTQNTVCGSFRHQQPGHCHRF